MAAVVLLSLIMGMGFGFACLALRQVRPDWFRVCASVGRWASFSIEMDGRQERLPQATENHVSDTGTPDLPDAVYYSDGHMLRP